MVARSTGRSSHGASAAALVAMLAFMGCAQPSRDRTWVHDELVERTGHGFETSGGETSTTGPLDEDEAVALALAHSPRFAADLARLDLARADFREAARLSNPRASLLAPIGPINAAASLLAPILELFQLPKRTKAAGRALESVAESLVQSGLDLVRDVRLAHIDADLATRRLAVLEELERNASDLADIADTRSATGDVSPAEAYPLRADALVAADRADVARRDRVVAIATLATLLGREAGADLTIVSTRPIPATVPALEPLLQIARSGRPDVRAAKLALESAAHRAGWERSRIVNLSVQADLQWSGGQVGARVGGVLEIPLFNQNQGGVGRAESAIEAAAHRVDEVRQRVTLEVVRARAQLEQALRSLERYERAILPPLDEALEAARLRYQIGDDSYLIVVDALTRLGAAQLRHVELQAEVRRAHAELERATGSRIDLAARGDDAR